MDDLDDSIIWEDKQWYRAIHHSICEYTGYLIDIDEKLERLIKIIEIVHKEKLKSN